MARGKNGLFMLKGFSIRGLKFQDRMVVTIDFESKATTLKDDNKAPIQFVAKLPVLKKLFQEVLDELSKGEAGEWKLAETILTEGRDDGEIKKNIRN